MTPEEIQELRDWAARKMGWTTGQTQFQLAWFDEKANFKMFKSQWLPDRPESGQIWMLVERMRELGWYLNMEGNESEGRKFGVQFYHNEHGFVPDGMMGIEDDNPCLAILKAARATED